MKGRKKWKEERRCMVGGTDDQGNDLETKKENLNNNISKKILKYLKKNKKIIKKLKKLIFEK